MPRKVKAAVGEQRTENGCVGLNDYELGRVIVTKSGSPTVRHWCGLTLFFSSVCGLDRGVLVITDEPYIAQVECDELGMKIRGYRYEGD